MNIPDRIKELRRVPARDLKPNPRNWRTHPTQQRDALRGILAEVGYADALLARELSDGSLELIDGHLRAETTPDATVPVLVLDISDEEADKLLLALDPLAAMAGRDEAGLSKLLDDVETDNAALQSLFDRLAVEQPPTSEESPTGASEPPLPESYSIIVQCDDEHAQRELYEELTDRGLACRLMNL